MPPQRSAVRLRRDGSLPSVRLARVALPVCLALVALALVVATRKLDADARSPYPLTAVVPYADTLARIGPPDGPALPALTPPPVPEEGTFRRGETLGRVLAELGLDNREAYGVTRALSDHLDVRRLRAGDPYAAFYRAGTRELTGLEIPVPGEGRALASRSGDGWEARWVPFERRLVPRFVEGTVEGSLIDAVLGAGAPALLAYRMADVLAWDVDFSRDLRRGDRFRVAYDEILLDGELAGVGEIRALAFENGGRTLEGYRYGGDYYDGEGQPLRKMFLRSPLRYSFVTSRFSPRRFHPVLKTYRPHWGVDYRAKVGTPVRVTAGGVVTFAGWSKGGGRMVKVRHPNDYLTAYLHLSRFAKGIRPGRRVTQGEVVAYSGNTGLSTAPHLDYRVQKNGRWINPLQLDNVPADPIPDSELADYLEWRDLCRASLDGGTPLTARPAAVDSPAVRVAAHGDDDGAAAGDLSAGASVAGR